MHKSPPGLRYQCRSRDLAEAVVAEAAEGRIGPSASEDDIVTSSTGNLVAATPSADEVKAALPLNLVGASARNDDVVTRGADDLIRPRSSQRSSPQSARTSAQPTPGSRPPNPTAANMDLRARRQLCKPISAQ
jgi:hypothetical protein